MALADPPMIPPQPAGGGTGGGRLAENVLHFARVLRAAGLPVGPGKTLDAVRAAETVGLSRRDDFYWALHAVFVNRRDQREVFDQAFHVFWRNPRILERMMQMVLPQFQGAPDPAAEEMSRRLAEALRGLDTAEACVLAATGGAAAVGWWQSVGRHIRVAVDGRALISRGVRPGPKMGEAIAAARAVAWDGGDEDAQIAAAMAVMQA